MKRLTIIGFIILMFTGCGLNNELTPRSNNTGITVTLYEHRGLKLETWTGVSNVRTYGPGHAFVTNKGKHVKISGGIIIIEE